MICKTLSFLLIASAMGTTLLPAADADQPKVLLLGDSISTATRRSSSRG